MNWYWPRGRMMLQERAVLCFIVFKNYSAIMDRSELSRGDQARQISNEMANTLSISYPLARVSQFIVHPSCPTIVQRGNTNNNTQQQQHQQQQQQQQQQHDEGE